MWILIIILGGPASSFVHHVPGFESRVACEKVAAEIRENRGSKAAICAATKETP